VFQGNSIVVLYDDGAQATKHVTDTHQIYLYIYMKDIMNVLSIKRCLVSWRMQGIENINFGCLIETGMLATNYHFGGG
jgi:hypothetical protein